MSEMTFLPVGEYDCRAHCSRMPYKYRTIKFFYRTDAVFEGFKKIQVAWYVYVQNMNYGRKQWHKSSLFFRKTLVFCAALEPEIKPSILAPVMLVLIYNSALHPL